jgi:integrase|tara:strand:+ start:2472 stop:3452 length:981 start_codon:yes stop_codon:yes gene_type:complete
MATIRKKREKWCVEIRRSFHKHISKTFISKQDAQRWARETERLIEIGQYQDLSEANKTTLKQLLERYEREVSSKKRTEADKYLIRNIMQHDLVNKVLSHVSSSDIAEFRDKRLETVSGSSVNRELSIISDCINRAITEWKCFISENPVKVGLRCKENPQRTRRLLAGEYEKLMNSCKKNRAFWCPIIDFAIHSAMRRGELLSITWDMVDLDKKFITLPPQITKTNKPRNVPLQPHAINILRSIPRSLNGRVFPIGIKNFERSWTAICKRAGIKGLRWHDLKREAVSRLFEKGLSVSEVQLFCGNSLTTLGVYTEHDSTTLAEKLAQ